MILFYSEYCSHCTMLLEHIMRYDSEKNIKLVSIDVLRSKNLDISKKIHSVPALMLMPSKEIIYGKVAFDYLLLPPRGILCSGNTRNDKNKKEAPLETPDNSTNKPKDNIEEPNPFSLNSSVLSDNYSNINEDIETILDKNYKWDVINSSDNIVAYQNTITDITKPISENIENKSLQPTQNLSQILNTKEEKGNKLPSLDDLQKLRDSEVFFT